MRPDGEPKHGVTKALGVLALTSWAVATATPKIVFGCGVGGLGGRVECGNDTRQKSVGCSVRF